MPEQLLAHARAIFQSAIDAVHPFQLIDEHIGYSKGVLHIGNALVMTPDDGRLWVIGAGKAAAAMAQALEKKLGDDLAGGVVITKYGHSLPCRRITVLEAGHPVPDENSLSATAALLQQTARLKNSDRVVLLLSGGGSALLEQLPPGISLADVQQTVQLLLGSGASIVEMNTVRKHLSLVKGGQLARHIFPAQGISLIISDVIGDRLDTIASGPTTPDATTFAEAWRLIEKYALAERLPAPVKAHLRAGYEGQVADTPKPGDPVFKQFTNHILGSNGQALQAALKHARKLGYHAAILTDKLQGEARKAAHEIAVAAQNIITGDGSLEKPACLLFGGETTVTLRGDGKGGRNQEFALAALAEMSETGGDWLIFSGGTDGTDGPTDAAGAFAAPEIWRKSQDAGLDPWQFLSNNDAYHFFEATGGLLKTGPTGTNVMDIGIVLVR